VVVSDGVCFTWPEAAVTGRESEGGPVEPRLCFCVGEAGRRSAEDESERLFLGCCPLLTGALK